MEKEKEKVSTENKKIEAIKKRKKERFLRMSSTQTTSVIIKLINIIKALKKLNENEFESEQCLEYLRKIDNSFNEEKQSRVEIAKVIIEYGYVGKLFISLSHDFLFRSNEKIKRNPPGFK